VGDWNKLIFTVFVTHVHTLYVMHAIWYKLIAIIVRLNGYTQWAPLHIMIIW